jgi:hypothetical protein
MQNLVRFLKEEHFECFFVFSYIAPLEADSVLWSSQEASYPDKTLSVFVSSSAANAEGLENPVLSQIVHKQ